MKLQTGVLRVLTLVVLSVTHTRTVQTATPVSGTIFSFWCLSRTLRELVFEVWLLLITLTRVT